MEEWHLSGLSGSERNRSRHIGYTIMYDIIKDENRIVMRSRPAGLNTATLVNSNIHQHRSGSHGLQHVTCYQPWCFSSRNEHCSYNEVMILYEFTDIHFIGIQGHHI